VGMHTYILAYLESIIGWLIMALVCVPTEDGWERVKMIR